MAATGQAGSVVAAARRLYDRASSIHPRQAEVFMTRIPVLLLLVLATSLAAAAGPDYPDGRELTARLMALARDDRAELLEIGASAGKQKLRVLAIAPAGGRADAGAVLVVANPGGTTPLASLAAVVLAEAVLSTTTGPAAEVRWYILPLANPDGFDRYVDRPRAEDGRNLTPVDDDHDGAEGEDPPDDLDGDGLITIMLLADPLGTWLIDPVSGIAREAIAARGESGLYVKAREGRDDDGDGRYNEDGRGGVVLDRNLPHRFLPWTADGGRWPADQPESRALLEFAFAHPEVAQVLVLGASNTLLLVPAPEPAPLAGSQAVRVPPRVAEALQLDPAQMYPVDDVLAAARQARLPDYTPERVRGLLSLGPRETPQAADLVWWREASSRYAADLAARGLGNPRLPTPPPPPGSVTEWAYYQFGAVSFAVDLWSPPCKPATPDSAAAAAPDTTGRDQLALRDFAAAHDGLGWRPWREVVLTDGRRAFTGGPAPYARTTPPFALVDSLLAAQVPLLLDLARWRPVLSGVEVSVEARGADAWQVTAFPRNDGPVPYPTAQGALCRRPAPLVLTLAGAEPLDGAARRTVNVLPAHGTAPVRWLVRGKPGAPVTITAAAPALGTVTHAFALTATGGRP
jgi:hypothetical protein